MTDSNDERKWTQTFADFDVNTQANNMFNMDDYSSNHEPSEADSPDSGGGTQKRNDLTSDTFMGGDQKQRRKEQNRAAQRAFRERKEKFVKELQTKIKELENKHEQELVRVTKENESLKELVKNMEAEIHTLKGAAIAFDVSIHKLREAGLDVQKHHNHPSPPHSDRQSPARVEDSFMSSSDVSFGFQKTINYKHEDHMMSTDEDNDEEQQEGFAERESNRFAHHVHPIVRSGAKVIPCSQIWEKLSQHPNFDEFDMDKLCEELKKKAICSGTGPVIPESELQEVLRRMDFGTA
ncbi:hypothetical protein INT48_005493 [Thamnidium elegans]|uniref:BZIP domain-containing protein n=1 Tax=Thamnidium elegans TaxID=101142 RepID=A0A8H7SW48_9FUNG|nr:hypothetical protein INT48_005493 [Thamnidium elegans]